MILRMGHSLRSSTFTGVRKTGGSPAPPQLTLLRQYRQKLTYNPARFGAAVFGLERAGANIVRQRSRLHRSRDLATRHTHHSKNFTKNLFHEDKLNDAAIPDN